MKKIIYSVTVLLFTFQAAVFSQTGQAMFQTVFYVVDAAGNFDSVTVGFDTLF